MTNAGFRIIDYTNAQLVTFNTGWTRLQTGTYRIVHVINLDEYQETLDYLNTTIQQKIINTNPLLPFLKHEVENIQNNLDKLKTQPKHNKNKRSIKILGTAWKWLSGSPDYDDFRILSEKINNALENSNDQIIINRVLSERIKNITEQSNKILSALKDNTALQISIFLMRIRCDLVFPKGIFALSTNPSSKIFHHVRFSKKRGLKPLKIAYLAIFQKLWSRTLTCYDLRYCQ